MASGDAARAGAAREEEPFPDAEDTGEAVPLAVSVGEAAGVAAAVAEAAGAAGTSSRLTGSPLAVAVRLGAFASNSAVLEIWVVGTVWPGCSCPRTLLEGQARAVYPAGIVGTVVPGCHEKKSGIVAALAGAPGPTNMPTAAITATRAVGTVDRIRHRRRRRDITDVQLLSVTA
jgi:hypothetical protein